MHWLVVDRVRAGVGIECKNQGAVIPWRKSTVPHALQAQSCCEYIIQQLKCSPGIIVCLSRVHGTRSGNEFEGVSQLATGQQQQQQQMREG